MLHCNRSILVVVISVLFSLFLSSQVFAEDSIDKMNFLFNDTVLDVENTPTTPPTEATPSTPPAEATPPTPPTPPAERPQLPKGQVYFDELNHGFEQSMHVYSAKQAASLNIPVAGTLGGNANQMVVVRNFIAYRDKPGDAIGEIIREGVGVRWIINISQYTANSKLTLPVIAANAELNGLEAYVMFSVVGAGFRELFEYSNVPYEMNVTNFVKMSQNFDKLIELLGSGKYDNKAVTPCVFMKIKPNATDDINRTKAVIHALCCIAKKSSLEEAKKKLNEVEVGNEVIATVYIDIAGIVNSIELPDQLAINNAKRKLTEMLGKDRADALIKDTK